MANQILTNSITDPTILMPWTGPELAFLQNGEKQDIKGLAVSLIGENIYIGNTAYILTGLNSYGTNQYTSGYTFYNDELYYSSGKTSTTAFSNIPVMVLDIANDPTVDPLTFSDGIARNVTNVRTLKLIDSTIGSGLFDLSAATYTQTNWNYVGTSGQPAFQNNFANLLSPSLNCRFRRTIGNKLLIDGNLDNFGSQYSAETTVFTLPVGYRPLYTNATAIIGNGGALVSALIRVKTTGDVTVQPVGGSQMQGAYICGLSISLD